MKYFPLENYKVVLDDVEQFEYIFFLILKNSSNKFFQDFCKTFYIVSEIPRTHGIVLRVKDNTFT
jgi:hypothetical protein